MAKPRQTVNWMQYYFQPTPKSVTHESLEMGRTMQTKVRIIARKQLNFQSYPMNDFRFDLLHFDKPKEYKLVSTYDRDYTQPFPSICKPRNIHDVEAPDPMFNRKPVNAFELKPWGDTKFMDDHMFNLSPTRRKINFFRQLRNRSFEFE